MKLGSGGRAKALMRGNLLHPQPATPASANWLSSPARRRCAADIGLSAPEPLPFARSRYANGKRLQGPGTQEKSPGQFFFLYGAVRLHPAAQSAEGISGEQSAFHGPTRSECLPWGRYRDNATKSYQRARAVAVVGQEPLARTYDGGHGYRSMRAHHAPTERWVVT
jgi:hypothetical protein